MCFVSHLESIRNIRNYVLDDLIFAKTLMVKCFPPYYKVFRNLLNMYHQALSTWIQELKLEDLDADEIMSLLMCDLNTYTSTEMMGNVELVPEMATNVLEFL